MGLPARPVKCKNVYDPVFMEFTKCEIYKK
jgi:hypothetical protein